MAKITNMTSSNGNKVANQFIIREDEDSMSGNAVEYFQSYNSVIAKRDKFKAGETYRKVWLDSTYWNYSKTTAKYRNMFLGETTKETQAKIDNGTYKLVNLN